MILQSVWKQLYRLFSLYSLPISSSLLSGVQKDMIIKRKTKEELEEFFKTATIEQLKEYKEWQIKELERLQKHRELQAIELEKLTKINNRLEDEKVGLQVALEALRNYHPQTKEGDS